MSWNDPRGGRQTRVRPYTWRDRGVSVDGAMLEVRQGVERRSVFVPSDQLARVADNLVDVLEKIEADQGAPDARTDA